VQLQTTQNTQERIPRLYVPLPAFCGLMTWLLSQAAAIRLKLPQTVARPRDCRKLSQPAAIPRQWSQIEKILRSPRPEISSPFPWY
jgi:hypothetical protein